MTTRFAAAHRGDSCLGRIMGGAVPGAAANDNRGGTGDDRMLRAALRHFATHGLGAAEAARVNAEAAFFTGDRKEYQWWIGICRMLDRRMADAVAARRDAGNRT